jgi:UDP-N-acetyl-D-glucosamine dehydrogenase
MSLGVRDTRESPALKTLTLLQGLGAELRHHDPHVPVLRDHGLQSVSLDDALEDADLALILTAHPQVDHQLLAQRARLLVDPHGVTRTLGVAGAVRL